MGSSHHPNTAQDSKYSLTPFFELSPYLLCIAGFDEYFKKVNPALSKLLGFTEDELLSEPINNFIHPEDREITTKHRDNIRGGKPLLNFENRYVTKEGDIVWFSWNSIPVYEDKLVYAIAKNITYKKKQEEKRNELLTELTETNQRLKQLNYTTSHDLRTPVTNLLSVFSLMNISSIEDKETLEFIELLKTATENLKQTLDGYVDNLRQEEQFQNKTNDVNLSVVLDDVRQSLDSLIKDSYTSFQLNFDGFRTVKFNRSYLESIYMNLITNSIKYSHPDRDPVISIKSSVADGQKKLFFSDNGLGFDSKKQQDRVSGLHQTFHDHNDSKGIGLYLVYNHVRSMAVKYQ